MKHDEYLAKRRQDPEYRKVERRLKLWLDFLDAVFYVRMWVRRALNIGKPTPPRYDEVYREGMSVLNREDTC